MRYGDAPEVLGNFSPWPCEMMFVQYLPIVMPNFWPRIPPNIQCFERLIDRALWDLKLSEHYVYLTAKRLYVTPQCRGNRPGWHSDGFGSDDVNYVWSDAHPTEFCEQPFDLSDDHAESLRQMEQQARPENIRTYPNGTLLRLTPSVIHRVSEQPFEGWRTFVKISVSKHRYDLEGNAHNYLFDYDWPMRPRELVRNHPFAA